MMSERGLGRTAKQIEETKLADRENDPGLV
jgi:hypothetical protein